MESILLKTKGNSVFLGLWLGVCLALSNSTQAALAGTGGAGDPEFRLKVLRMLKLQSFVRDASCSQFASLILSRSGLPAIAKVTPLKGERGDVDRRQEKREPPIFIDEIRQATAGKFSLRIEAKQPKEKPGEWELELSRTGRQAVPMRTRTVFRFRTGAARNHPSCELQSISFSASWSEAGKTSQPQQFKSTLSSDACLDLFDPDEAAPASEPARGQLQGFMKSDCSTGLRYFESVKRTLKNDADSTR